MLLGILSDSHDNLPRVAQAVALFNERDVDLVMHAGDVVAPFALAPLEDLRCDWRGVFGNNDGERVHLHKRSDGRLVASPRTLELGGRRIALMHEPDLADALAASGSFDLVTHGHTHRTRKERIGDCLILNPGECGGWLTDQATVAIVDLDRLTAEILPLG